MARNLTAPGERVAAETLASISIGRLETVAAARTESLNGRSAWRRDSLAERTKLDHWRRRAKSNFKTPGFCALARVRFFPPELELGLRLETASLGGQSASRRDSANQPTLSCVNTIELRRPRKWLADQSIDQSAPIIGAARAGTRSAALGAQLRAY